MVSLWVPRMVAVKVVVKAELMDYPRVVVWDVLKAGQLVDPMVAYWE